ncbi:histidine kinase [Frankia sp. AgB1.9]|uniref:sensor histidine kinase n=1 Tax=unclassified Frankia TaxID=2632575 RepID=UPI0019321A43|nr:MULTISPECIES: histidine kinase [unclassified Frankia]MBL7488683.1 histidine kinase [Frankia sp. AgW1.1]MBL7547833.1 histidine kinase [Frankia sp. AgB1.9]MBL7622040.1 histidine kinase [Frankia sp. AgB1.8]
MAVPDGDSPSVGLLAGHGVVLAGLAGANVWLGLRYGAAELPDLVSEISQGVFFAAAGLAIWRLRPRSRTGLWMLALGYLVFVDNPHDLQISTAAPGYTALTVVAVTTFMAQYAIGGHILLAYPSGRLPGRPERLVVASCFGLALAGGFLLLVSRTVDASTCTFWCYQSPVRLIHSARFYHAAGLADLIVWIGLAGAILLLLVRHARRSTPRRRRTLRLAFAMFGLALALFAGHEIAAAATGLGSPAELALYYLHQWAAVASLTVPFFAGLLSERLAFASVGALVGRLGHVTAGEVEAALGELLGDDGLRVAFPTADGLVDTAGHPYPPPSDAARAVTPLGDPPVALLLHDPALAEQQTLLDAAAGAARLALENARLHAEVRRQVAEVRASRQRLSETADAERRRLERDLHDGAQQRLLGIGLSLGVLREQLGGAAGPDLVDDLRQELHAAIHELRDLAQGIRPAILTEHGLGAALAELARRAVIRVSLDIDVPERVDPVLEATVYYVVSEALQNVAKHAGVDEARLSVVREPRQLLIEVTDRGVGGALVAGGTGLRGLLDRVDAVGGGLRIDSPAGGGTRLRAVLPCA